MNKVYAFVNSRGGRKLHRVLSIVSVIYLLMAVISGYIHMAMVNFFAPPPPVFSNDSLQIETLKVSLGDVLKKLSSKHKAVKAVSLRTVDGEVWYQIVLEGEAKPLYANTTTGNFADKDEAYAQQIAKAYLKGSTHLKMLEHVTAFNSEYINIFRILPVYHLSTENEKGERVYVSTLTGSVTLYLNKVRSFGQASFSNLHKLQFIQNHIVRDVLQACLLFMLLATAILGILLFFARRANVKR